MPKSEVQLSPTETAILMILADEPGLSVGDLGHELMPQRLKGNHRFAELHGQHYVAMAHNALQRLTALGFVNRGRG